MQEELSQAVPNDSAIYYIHYKQVVWKRINSDRLNFFSGQSCLISWLLATIRRLRGEWRFSIYTEAKGCLFLGVLPSVKLGSDHYRSILAFVLGSMPPQWGWDELGQLISAWLAVSCYKTPWNQTMLCGSLGNKEVQCPMKNREWEMKYIVVQQRGPWTSAWKPWFKGPFLSRLSL